MRKPVPELSPARSQSASASWSSKMKGLSIVRPCLYLVKAHAVQQCHAGEVPDDDVCLQAHEVQLARCQISSRRGQNKTGNLEKHSLLARLQT